MPSQKTHVAARLGVMFPYRVVMPTVVDATDLVARIEVWAEVAKAPP
jgi:hypothetical protein